MIGLDTSHKCEKATRAFIHDHPECRIHSGEQLFKSRIQKTSVFRFEIPVNIFVSIIENAHFSNVVRALLFL